MNVCTPLQRLAGRYDNPIPESTISPVRDYEFGYWVQIYISQKYKMGDISEVVANTL
jgi:hypothetical protein